MLSVKDIFRAIATFLLLLCSVQAAVAQDTIPAPVPKARLHREQGVKAFPDSLGTTGIHVLPTDSMPIRVRQPQDSLLTIQQAKADSAVRTAMVISDATVDSTLAQQARMFDDKSQWMPNPKKALWLAIVFPGGGQIYNRKFWKLPLFYGGFIGCVYAINWNNTMYRDYSQAYIDIMDDDPNTKSYENFIPRSYNASANASRLQDLFRRKKDFYRRYRDLSVFCVIGVYALSVLDAYIDAELSSFDISKDLSMKVRPSIINETRTAAMRPPSLKDSSYGVQCSITF